MHVVQTAFTRSARKWPISHTHTHKNRRALNSNPADAAWLKQYEELKPTIFLKIYWTGVSTRGQHFQMNVNRSKKGTFVVKSCRGKGTEECMYSDINSGSAVVMCRKA